MRGRLWRTRAWSDAPQTARRAALSLYLERLPGGEPEGGDLLRLPKAQCGYDTEDARRSAFSSARWADASIQICACAHPDADSFV